MPFGLFGEKIEINPWIDFRADAASLIDLQIWRKLRESYPKFNVIKYILLNLIYEGKMYAHPYDEKDQEFDKWIGVVRDPKFIKLYVGKIAYHYHIHPTTIKRHIAFFKKNGFVLKGEFGICLANDFEDIFENSTKDIHDENILVLDSIFLYLCKSAEEALVMSYILKRLVDTDIEKLNISDIRKDLSLDPKTVKSALINLEKNSFIKFDKRNVISTYFALGRYRLLKGLF